MQAVEPEKALMRLETPCLNDCEIVIDNLNFPDRIVKNIIAPNTSPSIKIETLNNLAKHYSDIGSQNIRYFEKLMEYVKPRTID